jgi:hypothetical protein
LIINKLYEEIDLPVFYFDELAIPFDLNWKNVGINLSGGADSAMLASMICKLISDHSIDCRVHIITYHRCWKTRPWQLDVSYTVFNKIKELFPNVFFERHVGYIPPELEWGTLGPIVEDKLGRKRSGDQIVVSSYNEYLIHQKSLDAIFEATTRNPTIDIEGKMPNREKSLDDAVLRDLIFKKNNGYVVSPFRFVQKDWILKQYKTRSLMNLYDLTRSCEGEFKDIDYQSYVPGQYVPVCKSCFWCKERSWAEESNE